MLMLRLMMMLILVGFYVHLYVHFVVNPNNEWTLLTDRSKVEISNQVYTKLPFVIEGKGMNPALLEPYVRFVMERKEYTQKKWSETHPACRTFYWVKKGTHQFTCIHPKFKKWVPHKKAIKENTDLLRITLEEDMILFVPNYWIVQCKGKGVVERIQYVTPLNQLAISICKIFK